MKTANGGATWTPQTANKFINGISCATASSCVAVSDGGIVASTTDGGGSWPEVAVNNGNFLSGVSCVTALVCFVDGGRGSVLRTTNGGASWAQLSSQTTSDLYQVSCATTTFCVAVGDLGTTTRTTDGTTWNVVPTGQSLPLFGVSCPTTLVCTAVGQNGFSPYTNDGGAQWNYYYVQGTIATLTSVTCGAAKQCFAAGVDGSVYVETPCQAAVGGVVGCWERSSTSKSGGLYAVSCQSASLCFAAGDFGTIITTSNGGTGWRAQSPNAFAQMMSISCPSTSVCFAAGFPANIVATSDGGTSWSLQQSNALSIVFDGISCPSTAVCFAVGDNGAIVATSDGGGHWTSQNSNTGAYLVAISCPTTSVCFAVGNGGVIMATVDGGTTWGAQNSGITDNLVTVSCPTSSLCYVGGYMTTSLGTTNGGATWSSQGSLTESLGSISCPSSTTCYGVGNKVHVTTNSGATWTDTSAPMNFYSAISCASTTVCTAVTQGDTAVSTSDGVAWSTQSTPIASGYYGAFLNGVSCPSTAVCVAAGTSGGSAGVIVGTTDGSATPWKWLAPSGTSDTVSGVSCPTTTTCFATANTQVFRTTNGGLNWFPVVSLPSTFNAISCPSSSVCFAVGRGCCNNPQVISTVDGGDNWSTQVSAPSGTGPTYVSVSCSSATDCVAVDAAGEFIKTVNGTTWSVPVATGATSLTGISCPSASVCFASDGATPGHIYSTADGGANWAVSWNISSDPQAGNSGPFAAIDCPNTTICYAVGSHGLIATTTDAGVNWRTETTFSAPDLTSVSCPSVTECFATASDSTVMHRTNAAGLWDLQDSGQSQPLTAVSCASATACVSGGWDGAIEATTDGGAAWTTVRPAESTADIAGMSCYGSSNCYAAASDTLFATHDGGANWSSSKLATSDLVLAISCPAAGTCVAVGWPGAIYKTVDGGLNWNSVPNSLYGTDETLTGVSCASLTVCVAVGVGGKVLSTSDGTNWNSETSGTTGNLNAISCPSTTSCVAVGGNGLSLTRTSGSWHAYPTGTTQNFEGINCPTVNTCYAVGTAGTIRVTTNRGTTWATRTSGTSQLLIGVACLAPSYCVAVGDFGTVLVTVDGATWQPRVSPPFNRLQAVAFPDLNHSWLAGTGGTILANPSLIPSCTSVSVSPDVPSPQLVGSVVTLNATSLGCPDPNPSYRFYLRSPGGVWTIVRNFSTSSSFVWNTKTFVPGRYTIEVIVKDAKSGFSYDAYTFRTFDLQRPPCTSVNVGSDIPSPQPSSTTVNFTATVTGCPTPLYQWWVNKAGVWAIVPGKDFAHSSSTFAWNTTGLPNGTYQVGVWAKQQYATRSYEAFAYVTYTLVVTSGTSHCQAVNIAASTPSPATKGASVVFTATPFSCGPVQYQWWLRDSAGIWSVVKPYPGISTYTLATASRAASTYLVGVWVRQGGSTSHYQAFSFITYTVVNPAVPTCTSVNLAPDIPAPSTPGTTVTFTATSAGCSSPVYQFGVEAPRGTWVIKQGYSAMATFAWDTTGLSPGPWQIAVWAKQSGSTASYQSFASITYQLTFG